MLWPLEKKPVRNKITKVIVVFPEFDVVCRNVRKKPQLFPEDWSQRLEEGHTSAPWVHPLGIGRVDHREPGTGFRKYLFP